MWAAQSSVVVTLLVSCTGIFLLKKEKRTKKIYNASHSIERGEMCLCLTSMHLWQEEAHHTDFLWHQQVTWSLISVWFNPIHKTSPSVRMQRPSAASDFSSSCCRRLIQQKDVSLLWCFVSYFTTLIHDPLVTLFFMFNVSMLNLWSLSGRSMALIRSDHHCFMCEKRYQLYWPWLVATKAWWTCFMVMLKQLKSLGSRSIFYTPVFYFEVLIHWKIHLWC